MRVDTTVFEIRGGMGGFWQVFEQGLADPLWIFPEKHEAIEFASSVARTRPPAELRVVAADGTLLGSRMVEPEAVDIWD